MIPIILIFVIITIIIVVADRPYNFLDFVLEVIMGLSMASIPALVFFGVQINSNIIEPVGQAAMSETLMNMNDASYADTHGTIRGGSFYVYGSISTDNQQTFNYYVKQSDGSFKLKSAPASVSTIIYTDGTPKVESTNYICERGKTIFELWSVASCDERPTTYKFYIPEGSIAEGYRLGE